MRYRNQAILTSYSPFSATILAAVFSLSFARETMALTADDVLNNMSVKEQTAYVAGIVGGLAYARFLRDRPDEAGMTCIYDWYYTGEAARHQQINQWFERHLDTPVEPLLYVLIKKECGE
jgi:hypothetical protein